MNMDWSGIVEPLEPPIQWPQLTAFENQIGFILPDDYKLFLFNWNGGAVTKSHKIEVSYNGMSYDEGVDIFYALSASPPSIGLIEVRKIQTYLKSDTANLLAIGDDMGTGFFYLSLNPKTLGYIYFAFKDDLQHDAANWEDPEARIPSYMVQISKSFTELGLVIKSSVGWE